AAVHIEAAAQGVPSRHRQLRGPPRRSRWTGDEQRGLARAPERVASDGEGLRVRPGDDERPGRQARAVRELDRAAPHWHPQPSGRLRIRQVQLTGVGAIAGEYVTIDECRIEYRRLGPRPGDVPTIVFLHEGLGSITQWRDFPAALCERTGCSGLVYN